MRRYCLDHTGRLPVWRDDAIRIENKGSETKTLAEYQ